MSVVNSFRLSHPKYADSAFSGYRAQLIGGRFNSRGLPVVYTSGSVSLCMLEILVQGNRHERLIPYICTQASFERSLVEWMGAGSMPDGWDALPYSRISQIVGNEWLESGRTAVLAVPSVVVPQEWNFLLNPKHRNFHKIKIADKVITPFDSRLIRL